MPGIAWEASPGKGLDVNRTPAPVIDYLRVSITDRCNFRCIYCMPPEGVHAKLHEQILSFEEIERFVFVATTMGVSRVRVTGGEPLVRKGCTGLLARLAALPGVEDLSLTTNGSLLAGHEEQLRQAGLSRINISIDSLNPQRFRRITSGRELRPVLAGLERALDAGLAPVKVNAVMLEGIEDDVEAFVRLARERPVHVRFIEFMPIGRRRGGDWRFVSRRRLMDLIGRFGKLEPAHSPAGGGPARYFRLDGMLGTVGFISSMSDHFCSRCNRLRLTADGRLRNCLFSDKEVDVRPFIGGDPDILRRVIRYSINSKRFNRLAEDPGARTMAQLGG
ncbi:MAG TPA: GTP 3',8-cyclase MoaA [Actinobacteria bacterium]|nr:GTP 3',8-cyclase MoaA [Actinomycetota bacterium]